MPTERHVETHTNPLSFAIRSKPTGKEEDFTVCGISEDPKATDASFFPPFNLMLSRHDSENRGRGGCYNFELTKGELIHLAHTILARFEEEHLKGVKYPPPPVDPKLAKTGHFEFHDHDKRTRRTKKTRLNRSLT